MKWYAIKRFGCPRCGQKLAVDGAQVLRGDVVTCQDCNQDIRLRQRGAEPGASGSPPSDAVVVEIRA